MKKKITMREQLTFNFDKEHPSLLEPLQQKEKELGASSPDLIPLKIKLINFYFLKGDVNRVYTYLKSLLELIHSYKGDDLPPSNYFEELSGPAIFIDQNIPDAGMMDRLNVIVPAKIYSKNERKTEVFSPIVISLKTERMNHKKRAI
jgi:hypothetical protein